MQIIWNLRVKLSTYAKDRNSVVFPVLEQCPMCGAGTRLVRHGFYSRYALFKDHCYLLDICRYLCRSCKKTLSLLPWMLLPRFQNTRDSVLGSLRNFLTNKPILLCRQLVSFYHHRFFKNIPAIITALREMEWTAPLPGDEKERAIKIVDRLLITTPCDSTLCGQYANRILTNFMAKSFYHPTTSL